MTTSLLHLWGEEAAITIMCIVQWLLLHWVCEARKIASCNLQCILCEVCGVRTRLRTARWMMMCDAMGDGELWRFGDVAAKTLLGR